MQLVIIAPNIVIPEQSRLSFGAVVDLVQDGLALKAHALVERDPFRTKPEHTAGAQEHLGYL